MAELSSTGNLGFTIPQTTTTFNPVWTAPSWKPSDFMAAYQFAPRPISPDAYSGALNQLGATIGQVTSPQFQLANYNSRGTLNAERNAPTTVVQQPAQTLALPVTAPVASTDAVPVGDGTFRTTTYNKTEPGVDPDTAAGRTSTGGPLIFPTSGQAGTAAVDHRLIPYGSIITRSDGSTYVAADTGGAVVNRTAGGGRTPVIDFYSDVPLSDYDKVTIRPPTADYVNLTPAQKLEYHRQAVTSGNQPAGADNSGLPANPSPAAPAPLFGWRANVKPPTMAATNVPLGATPTVTPLPAAPVSQPGATQPLALPAEPPLSPWRAQLQNALGSGHITVNPNGTVGYTALPPLNALEKEELATRQEDSAMLPLRIQQLQNEVNQGPTRNAQLQAEVNLTNAKVKAAQIQATPFTLAVPPSAPSSTAPVNTPTGTPVDSSVIQPFADGHVTVPMYVVKNVPGYYDSTGQAVESSDPRVRTLVSIKTLNPAASAALNSAETHGTNPAPFQDANGNLDVTALGQANGQKAQSLIISRFQQEMQANKPIQTYLKVAGNTQSIRDNFAIPKEQRTAADDDALMKAIAGVENPEGKPTEGELKALAATAGVGDRYSSYLSGVPLLDRLPGVASTNPRLLSDSQVANFGAVANRKISSLQPTYKAQMDQMIGQMKGEGIDPKKVFGDSLEHYNAVSIPTAGAQSNSTTKNLKTPDPATLAAARAAMINKGRAAVEQRLREGGYDPSGL